MASQSKDDSLGGVSPGDTPNPQVVSTGHSMETGKAGAIGLSEDQPINNDQDYASQAGGSTPTEEVEQYSVFVGAREIVWRRRR